MAKSAIEKANVVFKESNGDKFEVLKTRDDQLKLGGLYSEDLVEFYAKNNEGVIVLDFNGRVVGEEPLKVGDYVVATSADMYAITNTEMKLAKVAREYENGEIIIEIVAHDDADWVGDEYEVAPEYFRKATEAEIAELERQQAEKAISAKWASINRKPNEFKKGDIVRGERSNNHGEIIVGEICEVSHAGDRCNAVTSFKDGEYRAVYKSSLELITPVEARFDR